MANKKQGKVKAISVKEVTEGMQIILFGLTKPVIGYVSKIVTDRIVEVKGNLRDITSVQFSLNELKTLVVEYEDSGWRDGRNASYTTIQFIPLKYSQWQSAIDNGEVDSDKIVEFVKEGRGGEREAVIDIAKIIPQKKRMYSEEQIKRYTYLILSEFNYSLPDTYSQMDNKELNEYHKEWLKRNIK